MAPWHPTDILRSTPALSSIRNTSLHTLLSLGIKDILNQKWGWFIAMTGTDQIEHNRHMMYKLFQVPECKVWPLAATRTQQLDHCHCLFWRWGAGTRPQTAVNWHGVGLHKRLAVGKQPVESGLNQARRTGFVNWKPRRESADPSAGVSWDLAPIVSWALSDLPDLIQRSIHKANGAAASHAEPERNDVVFVSVWNSTRCIQALLIARCRRWNANQQRALRHLAVSIKRWVVENLSQQPWACVPRSWGHLSEPSAAGSCCQSAVQRRANAAMSLQVTTSEKNDRPTENCRSCISYCPSRKKNKVVVAVVVVGEGGVNNGRIVKIDWNLSGF